MLAGCPKGSNNFPCIFFDLLKQLSLWPPPAAARNQEVIIICRLVGALEDNRVVSSGLVGLQFLAITRAGDAGSERLLGLYELCIEGSDLLCKVVWKQLDFDSLGLELPQPLSGYSLVRVKNSYKYPSN